MARKGQTDPNAPIPGERRGTRTGSDTLQNRAIGDDEATRAEEMTGDATAAAPLGQSVFDVPTRNIPLQQSVDQTPIAPTENLDEATSAVDLPLESSVAIPEGPFEPEESHPDDIESLDDDDEEPIERTTIDSSLLEQLARTQESGRGDGGVGDKTNSLGPAANLGDATSAQPMEFGEKSSSQSRSRGSAAKRRPTNIEDVASATAGLGDLAKPAAPFEKSNATNPNDKPGGTLILEGDQHRKMLEARAGHPIEPADDLPSEQKTSARPLQPAAYSGDGPSGRIGSQSNASVTGDLPKEDDWGDYQDAGDDWGRGDSISDIKPAKAPGTNSDIRTPVSDGDSEVFAKPERSEVKAIVKLVAVEGEDSGEIDIQGDDVVFGREADCPIVLKDPSISRKHARLTRVENGWELIDLRSGNGTFVNGERVERAIVRHNDEVKLGSAVFRFVDPSEGMLPVDASAAPVLAASSRVALFARLRENPRLRTLVYGGAALSGLLLLVLVVLTFQRGTGGKAKTEVFQLYLQGVEQFKQHRWVPAEGFFAAALQRDHEHQRSRRYLEAIAVEKRAEQALATARAKLAAGDLGGAYENAIQASDSVFFGSEAQTVINSVDRQADERLAKARNALAGNDQVAAQNLLAGLEFYSAYRADLNEMRRQANLPPIAGKSTNILTQYEEPTAAKAERSVNSGGRAAPAARGPTSDAVDALADGHLDDALIKLKALGDNKEAADLADRVVKLNQLYNDGKSELAVKRADGAVRSLTAALSMLEHITGPRGELDKKIRGQLADALYLRAVAEYGSGKVDDAERTAKLATTYSANHENSVNLLTKIQVQKR